MTDSSPVAEVLAALRARLAARRSPPTSSACYLLRLTGPQGGTLHVILTPSSLRAGSGEPTSVPVDCTIELAATDALAMIGGRLNPVSAYLTGRIRLSGDVGVASRLGEVLR